VSTKEIRNKHICVSRGFKRKQKEESLLALSVSQKDKIFSFSSFFLHLDKKEDTLPC